MSEAMKDSLEQLRAIRKEAGRRIDPETADVLCLDAQTLDPYGDDPEGPYLRVVRSSCVCKVFARAG